MKIFLAITQYGFTLLVRKLKSYVKNIDVFVELKLIRKPCQRKRLLASRTRSEI